MTLATYSDLKAAIASWVIRTDLTASIPDFITLAEADINANLRVRRMEKRWTIPASAEYAALSTDFAGVKTMRLRGYSGEVDFMPFDEMDAMPYPAQTGRPYRYTIAGNELRFWPIPDAQYIAEVMGYARVPALSDTNQTNWLLTLQPDIYLFGALTQAVQFLDHDERAPMFASRYQGAMESCVARDELERGPSRNRAAS